MPKRLSLMLTCEHASHRVPAPFKHLFQGRQRLLTSHRGWDFGALDASRRLARATGAPLVAGAYTRLLIDLNRAHYNHRRFSPFTASLPKDVRQHIESRYYHPHRQQVLALAKETMPALHLAIHSFTPVLKGVRRNADLGFLYDPKRPREKEVAESLIAGVQKALPSLRIRRNYPYLGISDCVPESLRRTLPANRYVGMEIEFNQGWLRRNSKATPILLGAFAEVLNRICCI